MDDQGQDKVDDTKDLQKSMTEALSPIEKMPTHLLQNIQGALDQKEAGRTALVSKLCKLAWWTMSTLDFNDMDYGDSLTGVATRVLDRYKDENLRVGSFRLWSHTINHNDARNLIRDAINLGARDLAICVGPVGTEKLVLPEEVLGSPTLVKLCVVGCQVDFRVEVKCKFLEMLHIADLSTYGDIFNDLILKCTKLEKVEMGYIVNMIQETNMLGPNWENMIGKTSLQSLDLVGVDPVENITRFEVWAKFPVLKSLEILDNYSNLNWAEFEVVAKSTPGVESFKTNSVGWDCNLEIACVETTQAWFLDLKKLLKIFSSAVVQLTIRLNYTDAPPDFVFHAQEPKVLHRIKVLNIVASKEELVPGFLRSLGWYISTNTLYLGEQNRPDLLNDMQPLPPP
ncbi:hypothetical protein SASPL_127470 [Salvia splendens]|uniref:F-box domain-containing protein n=1 Tax=Salvia splendens TaxID=180675 RepID=A0A8X8X999_SALSN|nr:hypothetical protein SASPL_127470 [Salvia splendens]